MTKISSPGQPDKRRYEFIVTLGIAKAGLRVHQYKFNYRASICYAYEIEPIIFDKRTLEQLHLASNQCSVECLRHGQFFAPKSPN